MSPLYRYLSFRSDSFGSTESKSVDSPQTREELVGHTAVERKTAAVSLVHLAAELRANYRVKMASVSTTNSYSEAQHHFKAQCLRRRSVVVETEEEQAAAREESMFVSRLTTNHAHFG